jgi:hypothetical protein
LVTGEDGKPIELGRGAMRTSALRRELEQLSSDAGAHLLRALAVKGGESELRSASDEFSGHCLALTLLGSYLTDAYSGDIRRRKEVSEHLAHDVRQGVHARKVMESYQTWFWEGPELSVLRMLGLFDRPAEEKAIAELLKPPAIPDLTASLTALSPTEWRTILAKLRRARLLAGEDPHNPGQLDTHPLVREYFGEQLLSQRIEAWKECNKRLYKFIFPNTGAGIHLWKPVSRGSVSLQTINSSSSCRQEKVSRVWRFGRTFLSLGHLNLCILLCGIARSLQWSHRSPTFAELELLGFWSRSR